MQSMNIEQAFDLLSADEREVTAMVAHAKYDQAIGIILLDIAQSLRKLCDRPVIKWD